MTSSAQDSHPAENDAALCLNWQTYWPHAVPDIRAVNTTDDPTEVTCNACLWALGSQKHEPPRTRVAPPGGLVHTPGRNRSGPLPFAAPIPPGEGAAR